MLQLALLVMFLSVGCAQEAEMIRMMRDVQTSISMLNLRLARIEARQTRNMIINSKLKDSIRDVKTDLQSKHAETMIWLRNTVRLLSDLKMRDDTIEATQKNMSSDIQKISSTVQNCCRNDSTRVACPTSITSTTISITSPTTTPTSPTTPGTTSSATAQRPTTLPSAARPSCKSVQQGGAVKDGVFTFNVAGKPVRMFCSSGYTTIQRRFSGGLRFDRSFSEYEHGFGDVAGEHWLGLLYQHEMTSIGECSFRLLLDMDTKSKANNHEYYCGDPRFAADCDGKVKITTATDFRVSPALDLYRINVKVNSTDFLRTDIKHHFNRISGQQFSARDKGPQSKCTGSNYGEVAGGFWYNQDCYPGQPNSVITTSESGFCISSNKVCGRWGHFNLKASWMQFQC